MYLTTRPRFHLAIPGIDIYDIVKGDALVLFFSPRAKDG